MEPEVRNWLWGLEVEGEGVVGELKNDAIVGEKDGGDGGEVVVGDD